VELFATSAGLLVIATHAARENVRSGVRALDGDGRAALATNRYPRRSDVHRRFRGICVAELAETALREMLADLRPKAAAIRRYIARLGPTQSTTCQHCR
jgi:hypothetical protein